VGALEEFWLGFRTLFSGFRRLARLPQSYPFALVPAAVFLILETGFVFLSVRILSPWVRDELAGQSTLRNAGAEALSWLSVAIGTLLGWFVAALVTPPLSAPALERIVGLVEPISRRRRALRSERCANFGVDCARRPWGSRCSFRRRCCSRF
jgi:hypothetical protein